MSNFKRLRNWLFLVGIVLAGCRYGLPASEVQGMEQVEQGWEKIVDGEETEFLKVAVGHEQFMGALEDTSNWQRRQAIAQDTALRLQIHRLDEEYEGAKRRHIYNMKRMRTFLDDTKVWLRRVATESSARQLARRSWQARTTTFKTLYAQVTSTRQGFATIEPHYGRITKLLPSLESLAPETP
ncbi:MAG: hypothetical protein U0176_18130 [Bacteroidia bacterium]